MSQAPVRVRIVEVGPRDGLQNEKTPISVADKVALIDLLSQTGLKVIEAGAFVSPKKVPQMADTDQVLAAIRRAPGVSYPVLVPNLRGFEDAWAAGAREVAVFAAASETFSRRNIDCSIEESFTRFEPVMAAARAKNVPVRGYVSCILGCPYEGDVPHEAVLSVVERLFAMGCAEVSLGDTIGVGEPKGVASLLHVLRGAGIDVARLAGHFHDTHGRALANIEASIAQGIRIFDSAVGGLGGCPYAPGSTGNVATEALCAFLAAREIGTGIDSSILARAAALARSLRSF